MRPGSTRKAKSPFFVDRMEPNEKGEMVWFRMKVQTIVELSMIELASMKASIERDGLELTLTQVADRLAVLLWERGQITG